MINKLRNFFKSKYFWMVIAFLAVSCFIWYVGPLIGIANVLPLDSVAIRIVLIIWSLVLILSILNRWMLIPYLILTGIVVFWVFSPSLSIAGVNIFAGVVTRLVVIAIAMLFVLIWAAFRLLKYVRQHPELLAKIVKSENEQEPEDASDERNKQLKLVLSHKLNDLLSSLKKRVNQTIKVKIFQTNQYKYALPWFMSIGNEGSGKSTGILNSGVLLTEPSQIKLAADYLALQEASPSTEEGDFWLSHDAVFIDTSSAFLKNKAQSAILLSLLKEQRPKMPINGLLVNLSIDDLLLNSATINLELAANLRENILRIKKELAVSFPVYVLINKSDKLKGFKEYFSSLTEEARQQPFGFTLPLSRELGTKKYNQESNIDLEYIQTKFADLHKQLESNLYSRINDEHSQTNKNALYAFPEEFEAISQSICNILNIVFMESKVGHPELNQNLRGVFFISSKQDNQNLFAKQDTILERFHSDIHEVSNESPCTVLANKSFFTKNVFQDLLLQQSGLTKPNKEWQFKNLLTNLSIKALVAVIFTWLLLSFSHSYSENSTYLSSVGKKVGQLDKETTELSQNFQADKIAEVLDAAQTLPSIPGWNLSQPLLSRRYGLYTSEKIVNSSQITYMSLADKLLVTQLVGRIESVIRHGISDNNPSAVANALSVYLMLHDNDASNYRYRPIKDWLSKDWLENNQAYNFGGRASIFEHLDNLFVDGRIVKSPSIPNSQLITEARDFLKTQSNTKRIYESTKAIIASSDEIRDFSLVTLLGSEAAVAFRFKSGRSIDTVVSGIYTYDGFHDVFKPKLKQILRESLFNDIWLMGGKPDFKKISVDDTLMNDILTEYLNDYTEKWKSFLADIDAQSGDTLSYDVNLLRIFASGDSAMTKLANAVVREVSLGQKKNQNTIVDAAASQGSSKLNQKVGAPVAKGIKNALSQEDILVKTLVDDKFLDLRSFVDGNVSQTGQSSPAAGGSNDNINSMSAYNNLINEIYLNISIANTTLQNGGIPTNSMSDIRMKFIADRLPNPFKQVLWTLTESSFDKIKAEKEIYLEKQANVLLDQLMVAYEAQIKNVCLQQFSGKYPFVVSAPNEVALGDFSVFFSQNGVVDQFVAEYLSKYIDTNNIWRYKTINEIQLASNLSQEQNQGANAPNASSAVVSDEPTLESVFLKLLQTKGPSLRFFMNAKNIQKSFFQNGGQEFGFNYSYDIVDVDPLITELILNFDGDVQRYMHNATRPRALIWPSKLSKGAEVQIMATPKIRYDTSIIDVQGPWALFRFFDKANVSSTSSVNRNLVNLSFEQRRVQLVFNSDSSNSGINLSVLRGFNCQ